MLRGDYKKMHELRDRQTVPRMTNPPTQRLRHCLCTYLPGHQNCSGHFDSATVLGFISNAFYDASICKANVFIDT